MTFLAVRGTIKQREDRAFMNEITQITPQVKDKRRCNVYVDGCFCCGLTLETAIKNRLKVGMTISKEELSLMQMESEKQTALDKALTHISSTQKTEREIRDFLKKKGYLTAVQEYVIEKMKGYHFIDDEQYAKGYAESAIKRMGKRKIALELKKKGIAEAEIENATGELEGEEETAKRLLMKYMKGKTTDIATLQKAFRHLLSKGFDYEICKSALANFGEVEE